MKSNELNSTRDIGCVLLEAIYNYGKSAKAYVS